MLSNLEPSKQPLQSPKLPQSPALSSLTSARSRRDSQASAASAHVNKEQLAQQLDEIHNSASQSDALTTFNAFSPSPSNAPNIVETSKGLAGDIVQTGFSGLYTRFKEAVGVSSKSNWGGEIDRLDFAAKRSTTTINTVPWGSDAASTAPGSAHGSINSLHTRGSEPGALVTAEELLTATAVATADIQSQISQGTQSLSSGNNNTGNSGLGAVPSKHSLAALALASATPAAGLLSINTGDLSSRGRSGGQAGLSAGTDRVSAPVPAASGAAAAAGLGNSLPSASGSLEKLPHAATQPADSLSLSPPITAEHKMPLPGDQSDTASSRLVITREDTVSINSTAERSPVSGQDQQAMLPTLQLPSGNSSRVSIESAGARKPAIINRIARSRSPVHAAAPKTSLVDWNTGPVEPTPINTSAHNSVYHDSFAHDSKPQQTRGGRLRIPGTTNSGGGGAANINSRLQSVRNKMMSKDFWMADETCNECFACQTPFTAWRRKHHCRTCGRIFDSKCTSIIPAQKFGLPGTVRVCKTCLAAINKRLDDNSASDESGDDEGSFLGTIFRPNPRQNPREPDQRTSMESISNLEPDESLSKTPLMAIAATRRLGDYSNRNSSVLEINATPQPLLSRPSSSRSLKSLAMGRPQSSAGHKRHHSRTVFNRLKAGPQERDTVPFRQGLHEDPVGKPRFPAFHDDNVIDPDLEPFMSDESSGDEQISISAAIDNPATPGLDFEKPNFGTFLTTGKKHRMRQGEKSISGLSFTSRGGGLNDNAGPGSLISHSRSLRRTRNVSIAGMAGHHMRPPRPKSATISGIPFKMPSASTDTFALLDCTANSETPRVSRSGSMSIPRPNLVTLGPASMTHVKKLLRQLLQDCHIPNQSAWEKALVPVLLRCTDDIEQNVRLGDDIDIRHYVKFKKIPGARPSDTNYVSGVIFTKKLALKTMPRAIVNPRIVLVSFPIEYQRHQQQQHFMSLQPVMEQEKEFLRVIINRIRDLHPHVLFAERNVSGVALQYLSEAGITVAYNVKRTVIEALSRCCNTEIISSIDMLAIPGLNIGEAGRFEVKTYVNNDYPGRKKTYIFVSECDKDLGCTIALRGAPTAILHRVKRITEFLVYVVYNLKLESCYMRDASIHVPSSVEEWSIPPASRAPTFDNIQSARPPSTRTITMASQETGNSNLTSHIPPSETKFDEKSSEIRPNIPQRMVSLHETHTHSADTQLPDDVPMPTFYSDMVAKYQTKILSASPFVKFTQPHLLMKAREQERKLVYLRRLRDQDMVEEGQQQGPQDAMPRKFQLIKPEMVHEIGQKAPKQIMEILHAAHDAEYDKALYHYQTQTRQWENSLQGTLDLFDPFSHQSIAVLYSVTCTETKIPCIEPSLIGISFYDELRSDTVVELDPDCTLGQYVEDLCLSAEQVCEANACGKPMHAHHRTYVHDEARITVFVTSDKSDKSELDDSPKETEQRRRDMETIFMWSYCKLCRKETPRNPMSQRTWMYSFGKFLELSFWCRGLSPAVEMDCPHDYHRDHIRYFGYMKYSIRFHYDPIDLLEIVVPRARITWKIDNDLKLKNEIYTKTEERWNLFINSVKARLASIRSDAVLPEKVQACTEVVSNLKKKAAENHSSLLETLQDAYMSSKYYEVVPMNKVIHSMLETAAEWDAAFSQFETDFLPDKDVRQITVLQLKKMFTDNRSLESVAPTDTATLVGSETDGEKPTQSSLESEEKDGASLSISEKVISNYGETGEETSIIEVDPAVDDSKPQVTSEANFSASVGIQEQVKAAVERVGPLDLATPGSPSETKLALAQTGDSIVAGNFTSSLTQDFPSAQQQTTGRSSIDVSTLSRIPCSQQQLQLNIRQSKDASMTIPAHADSEPILEPPKTIQEHTLSPKAGVSAAPPIFRAATQPPNCIPRIHSLPKAITLEGRGGSVISPPDIHSSPESQDSGVKIEKKLTERLVINTLKGTRKGSTSAIPRFVGNKKKEVKVTSLARHFEQLSREFERERIKDRKQRAAKYRDSRAFLPRASTKAVVEVYNDVAQAVEEQEPLVSQEVEHQPLVPQKERSINQSQASRPESLQQEQDTSQPTITDGSITVIDTQPSMPSEPVTQREELATGETGNTTQNTSTAVSDDDSAIDDEEKNTLDTIKDIADSIDARGEVPEGTQKSNLMKIITNFWAERSASSWPQLEYPLSASDHIFMDSDIIVREDEPSSLISFALGCDDYQAKLEDIRRQSHSALQESSEGPESSEYSDEVELEQSLLCDTGKHLKYQFQEGSARMLCKIFYAEQFDALRRKCGVADRIVESLSRCLKWDSKGGKTKSVFLKTLDDRLVMKSLSPVETSAFLRFAPAYFGLMAEALFHDLPSVIAKMLGFFQISIKNPVTGTDMKLDLLLMENLFYDRSPSRIFDLKGSMRNRKIEATGEQNEVLLDENMVEYIYESPLFAREHSKKIISASVS